MKTPKFIQSLALAAGSLLPTQQAKAQESQTITVGKTCEPDKTCEYTSEEVRAYINQVLGKACKIIIVNNQEETAEDGSVYKLVTAEVKCPN